MTKILKIFILWVFLFPSVMAASATQENPLTSDFPDTIFADTATNENFFGNSNSTTTEYINATLAATLLKLCIMYYGESATYESHTYDMNTIGKINYWNTTAEEWFFSGGSYPKLSSLTCDTGIIEGCTDSLAFNFDPLANVDDGTCEYPVVIQNKIEGGLSEDIFTKQEIYNIFQMEFMFLLLWSLIICAKKLGPDNKYRRFKFNKIFK